jgi:hypothetical protein
MTAEPLIIARRFKMEGLVTAELPAQLDHLSQIESMDR